MAVIQGLHPPSIPPPGKRHVCNNDPQSDPERRAVTSHDHHVGSSQVLDVEAFPDQEFDLLSNNAVSYPTHFEEAFAACTQSRMGIPDSTGQDTALLMGDLDNNATGCAVETAGPSLQTRSQEYDPSKFNNPALETCLNGLSTRISSYTSLLRGSMTYVQPRNMLFVKGCTFMSTKQLVQRAKAAKNQTQFPVIQLYARVVYSSRENFLRQQYFQLSDLIESGGLLSGSLHGWETSGLLDINAAELLGESPNGIKCYIQGRLVKDAQSECGLVLNIHDIRYAGWAEIRLMNDALGISDPKIPPAYVP